MTHTHPLLLWDFDTIEIYYIINISKIHYITFQMIIAVITLLGGTFPSMAKDTVAWFIRDL